MSLGFVALTASGGPVFERPKTGEKVATRRGACDCTAQNASQVEQGASGLQVPKVFRAMVLDGKSAVQRSRSVMDCASGSVWFCFGECGVVFRGP